jgi:hypothetical protein
MTYFAKVDNEIVQNVISADQEFVDSQPGTWVQTDKNAYGGEGLRANYAGIGYTYDITNDVFYAPQPFPSWTISAPTWLWTAPIPYPSDGGLYEWNETTLSWVKINV